MVRGAILMNGGRILDLRPHEQSTHLYPARMVAARTGVGFMALGNDPVPTGTPLFLMEDEVTTEGVVLPAGTEVRFDPSRSNPSAPRSLFDTTEEAENYLNTEFRVVVCTADKQFHTLTGHYVRVLMKEEEK